MIYEWSPNDYSPLYIFQTDDNGNFVKLITAKEHDGQYAKELPDAQVRELENYLKDQNGYGWQKFLKHAHFLNYPEFRD